MVRMILSCRVLWILLRLVSHPDRFYIRYVTMTLFSLRVRMLTNRQVTVILFMLMKPEKIISSTKIRIGNKLMVYGLLITQKFAIRKLIEELFLRELGRETVLLLRP